MSEALYIPEEHLEEVVALIRFALKKHDHVSRSVRTNLSQWCNEQEEYLKELKDEDEQDNAKPARKQEEKKLRGRIKQGQMCLTTPRYAYMKKGKFGMRGVGTTGGNEIFYDIINTEMIDATKIDKTYVFKLVKGKAFIVK